MKAIKESIKNKTVLDYFSKEEWDFMFDFFQKNVPYDQYAYWKKLGTTKRYRAVKLYVIYALRTKKKPKYVLGYSEVLETKKLNEGLLKYDSKKKENL